jgi:hypothetical protein
MPEQRRVLSPDGRWIVWPGPAASQPAMTFNIDFSGLSPTQVPRMTVVRPADQRPVVDGAEMPADMGESISVGPVPSADSARVAVQVGARLLFWDVPAATPLDAGIALPPGALLIGAASDGSGCLAGSDAMPDGYFVLDADPSEWARVACTLVRRALRQR